jgi:hypothetical protein
MLITITSGRPCKAAPPLNDNLSQAKTLSPVEGYAVRAIARRAGISPAHALVAAELAGIVRGVRHG